MRGGEEEGRRGGQDKNDSITEPETRAAHARNESPISFLGINRHILFFFNKDRD